MTLNNSGVRDIGRVLQISKNTVTSVLKKLQQRLILAWYNGKRQDKDFLVLWYLLQSFPISCYYTDDRGSYSKYIPAEMHRTGKDKTWKIERKNLNFRTHIKRLNRKTICFSKNEHIHDNVIGTYIETFYYKTGTYGNN